MSPSKGAARIPAEGGSVSHRRARLLPLRTVPQDIAQDIALIKPLQVAIEAAHAASEPILERFRAADLSVDNKGDGSPVSEADKAAEKIIRHILSGAFPSIDIYGEEEGFEDTGSTYRWVVDPIDGTLSFVAGIPLFGTLIALEERASGKSLLGVIHLPALGETYAGGRGLGVRCNETELAIREDQTVHSDNPFTSAIISAGDPLQFQHAGCAGDHAKLSLNPLFRGYSDCFGHAMVLRGSVGAMVDPALAPWDLAATSALIRAAGGAIFTRPSKLQGYTDAILGRPSLVRALVADLGWAQ